ncbi:hypothetical protein [Streptomyces sp. NBC_00059]|uniref:hypothetical protein n=1 Tax=Streptomyces sp. NBC_00059 TaxID=2975635 RepID=UPI002252B4D9|nr:hypothetical protein [Streptomyces sp. NBC_00059]MCX5414233.1 hypothetical protein [Streptomyces sp. NBC_00059]
MYAPADLAADPPVRQLPTYWGGEAVYWQHCESSPYLAARPRSPGTPSVVTALLDLTPPDQKAHSIFPSIIHVLTGRALGHEPADADLSHRSPVPSERTESIVANASGGC